MCKFVIFVCVLLLQPIDSAKEDFRRYLDRKGVMDTLTKAFISCYDDRPENPTERLLEVLSDTSRQLPSNYRTKLETAELQLAEARIEIEVLRKQLEALGVKPAEVQKPPNTVSANVPTPTTPAISSATVAALQPKESPAPEQAAAPVTAGPAAVVQPVNEESAKSEAVSSAAPSSPAKAEAVPASPTAEDSTAKPAEEQPSTST